MVGYEVIAAVTAGSLGRGQGASFLGRLCLVRRVRACGLCESMPRESVPRGGVCPVGECALWGSVPCGGVCPWRSMPHVRTCPVGVCLPPGCESLGAGDTIGAAPGLEGLHVRVEKDMSSTWTLGRGSQALQGPWSSGCRSSRDRPTCRSLCIARLPPCPRHPLLWPL